MAKTTTKDTKVMCSFSALDPYLQTNIVSNVEKEVNGKNFIEWGERNMYPDFLYELYRTVPTLQSIINGSVDFVIGDGVKSNTLCISEADVEDLVRDIAFSYMTYGGFAINVLRNKLGGVARLVVLDFKNIRSDRKGENFYYSEDWSKSYGRVKYTCYPAFDPEAHNVMTSIFYYKNVKYSTYPSPLYGASVKSAQIERQIAEYQLNAINNGFASNVIVSLNNGTPSDEQKEEIEEAFNEKFTGYENAGRPMIIYNQDKEHSVEISKVDTDNFVDKYNTAVHKAKQDLFTSFRAHPVLFGIPTEGTGWNDQDFEQGYKLFNRTVVRPIQKVICNAVDKITGTEKSLSIKPFTIDWTEEEEENNVH